MIINDPVQGVILATDADNLSVVGRRPVIAIEEPVIFMSRSEIEGS